MGPAGMKYFRALIQKATELAEQAEAAAEEQEPEMMEKCKEITTDLRSFIAKVAQFNDDRYGTTTPEQEGKEKESPTATLTKSAQTSLFYGTAIRMPDSFVKGLQFLNTDVQDESHRKITAAMLKGLAIPEVVPDPAVQERESLRERIAQIKKKLAVGAIS